MISVCQVLHRDLSLRNILLKGDFIVKISDFGLSRITKAGYYVLGNPDIQHPLNSAPENNFSNVAHGYWCGDSFQLLNKM